MSAALAAIWERHREPIFEQIGVVERAALAALRGGLDEPVREPARRDAHKLAGSLGSFGFPTASEHARRLERLLESDAAGLPASARELCDLVVALRGALEDGAAPAPAPAPVEAAVGEDSGPLVLIVEDDQVLADRLIAEATQRGLCCRHAPSPAEARPLIAARRPDLVLLDLTFDGATAAAYELLAELSAEADPVPVLVLTVRDVFTDRVEVARRGGRGFVAKSLPPRQVIDQIEQLIERTSPEGAVLLAVDDDPSIGAIVKAVLEPVGMRVATLSDPLRFWEELERVNPDMLLLDIDMPEITGIDLCRVARNDRRWATLPTLFLSSRGDSETIAEVFAAGADDYLRKPVVPQELLGRVRNRLERLHLHRFIADRDALTGVRNRASSTDALERLLALARRFEEPVTLAAIDLDHFKSVNDRYGHAAGDVVLRRLGELLAESFRGEDVVGRWGGEEFIVGMYGMSGEDAVRRMHGLLATFENERFRVEGEEPFAVTFSAGLAVFPEHGRTLGALHRAADAALYGAKEAGRARVQRAGEPAPAPADQPDVVVVDDDDALVDVLVHSLETEGHRVLALRDGAQAGAALAGDDAPLRPRVIVLDNDLPGLAGMAVLRRLRAGGVLARTNVIMLTGHASEHSVLESLRLGAIDHLAKPFSVPVLMHKVAQALRAKPSSPRTS